MRERVLRTHATSDLIERWIVTSTDSTLDEFVELDLKGQQKIAEYRAMETCICANGGCGCRNDPHDCIYCGRPFDYVAVDGIRHWEEELGLRERPAPPPAPPRRSVAEWLVAWLNEQLIAVRPPIVLKPGRNARAALW